MAHPRLVHRADFVADVRLLRKIHAGIRIRLCPAASTPSRPCGRPGCAPSSRAGPTACAIDPRRSAPPGGRCHPRTRRGRQHLGLGRYGNGTGWAVHDAMLDARARPTVQLSRLPARQSAAIMATAASASTMPSTCQRVTRSFRTTIASSTVSGRVQRDEHTGQRQQRTPAGRRAWPRRRCSRARRPAGQPPGRPGRQAQIARARRAMSRIRTLAEIRPNTSGHSWRFVRHPIEQHEIQPERQARPDRQPRHRRSEPVRGDVLVAGIPADQEHRQQRDDDAGQRYRPRLLSQRSRMPPARPPPGSPSTATPPRSVPWRARRRNHHHTPNAWAARNSRQ